LLLELINYSSRVRLPKFSVFCAHQVCCANPKKLSSLFCSDKSKTSGCPEGNLGQVIKKKQSFKRNYKRNDKRSALRVIVGSRRFFVRLLAATNLHLVIHTGYC
jgi:hypothetical protein